MSEVSTEKALEIIDVPPELRGPSDEEIIQMSEKVLREVSGKRKKGERRPSKRARIAMRQEKGRQEAEKLALEMFGGSRPMGFETTPAEKRIGSTEFKSLTQEKQSLIQNAFSPKSTGYDVFYSKTDKIPPKGDVYACHAAETSLKYKSVPDQAPASGRVLKASFGSKIADKPKAVIVSAAELAKQRAEERAKKIREALLAKKAPAMQIAGDAIGQASTSSEAEPVKRPRGRPRKNPVV